MIISLSCNAKMSDYFAFNTFATTNVIHFSSKNGGPLPHAQDMHLLCMQHEVAALSHADNKVLNYA